MLDLRWIRDNPESLDRGLARRGAEPAAGAILAFDEERRAVQTELQELQQRRNAVSKEIGAAKQQGRNAEPLMAEVARIKDRVPSLEESARKLDAELDQILAGLPNLLADDVPHGADESANVELRRYREPSRIENAADHADLGERLGFMDFAAGASLSGARFTVLRGQLARLERALGQFMLSVHTEEHGYTEISGPLLVRDEALFGTSQLPKFADQQFRTTTGHWLIPTAEVTLTNLAADRIMDAEDLPLRLTALTPCFRSEAGAAGRDTRGMLRQHQFWKVELVSITLPDQSAGEHERMTGAAETILQRLELPYRVVVLASGDTGFSARKTYDLEVWLPGQKAYREISSCSNCGDFQARRMKARFRRKGEKGTEFVHTLNGSGVAVGRALIAVMENYQQPDGSIIVPDVLRPYMGGLDRIAGNG